MKNKMKATIVKSLGMVTIGLWSLSAPAAYLRCEVNAMANCDNCDRNDQTVITETVTGTCRVSDFDGTLRNDQQLEFDITGKGAGARWAESEGFLLHCPTASRKNLTRNPFFGLKASAGLIAGADVGIFANKRGGVCILTGAQFNSYGAGVSGMKLNFTEL